MKITKPILIALTVLILSVGANFALADTPVDKYSSGYKHGCSDAKLYDSDEMYINQPGKGASHHSDEFMNGYWTGRENCYQDEDGYTNGHKDKFNTSPTSFFNQVSSDDDERDVSCGDWKNGRNNCYVDGKLVVLNSPNHVDSLTQAQSQSQHVTCITIFSVCGNNNQQGMAQSTSLSNP